MNVKTATTAQLVAFYNEHADKPVTTFRDRATAEKRCQELLDLVTSNEAAPVEAPAKPAKKDDGFLANTVAFAKNREEEKVSGKKEKSMLKSLLNQKPVDALKRQRGAPLQFAELLDREQALVDEALGVLVGEHERGES